jgi:hypothetical protein
MAAFFCFSGTFEGRLSRILLAGAEGFEPSDAGFKVPSLTTWRRPNGDEGGRSLAKKFSGSFSGRLGHKAIAEGLPRNEGAGQAAQCQTLEGGLGHAS